MSVRESWHWDLYFKGVPSSPQKNFEYFDLEKRVVDLSRLMQHAPIYSFYYENAKNCFRFFVNYQRHILYNVAAEGADAIENA